MRTPTSATNASQYRRFVAPPATTGGRSNPSPFIDILPAHSFQRGNANNTAPHWSYQMLDAAFITMQGGRRANSDSYLVSRCWLWKQSGYPICPQHFEASVSAARDSRSYRK